MVFKQLVSSSAFLLKKRSKRKMAVSVNVNTISSLTNSKVQLTTKEGVYTGIVVGSSDSSKVVINEASCVDPLTGQSIQFSSLITIFTSEIIDSECLSFAKSTPPPKSAPVVMHFYGQPQPTPEPAPDPVPAVQNQSLILDAKCIPFDELDERNDKRPKAYVVVDRLGDMFNDAIALIKSQLMIGVSFAGIELGRHGQLCWINISTKEVVLMFDLIALNTIDDVFDNGFREIFQSLKILKIMHDCRKPSDILHHQFDTKLQNVYDTQVADIMISRWKNGGNLPRYVRRLDHVLIEFLGLSEAQVAFYEIRKSSLERDFEIWRRRPLSSMMCQLAALSVRYLRELRLVTLEYILQDFTHGVDLYLDVRVAEPDNRLLIPSDAVLPKEFEVFGYTEGDHCASNDKSIGDMMDHLTLRCEINESPVTRSTVSRKKNDSRRSNGSQRQRTPTTPQASYEQRPTSTQYSAQPKCPLKLSLYPAGMNWNQVDKARKAEQQKKVDSERANQSRKRQERFS